MSEDKAKTAKLWEKLGKLSAGIGKNQDKIIELRNVDNQLQKQYQEVLQSIQAIKSKPETSLPEAPKT